MYNIPCLGFRSVCQECAPMELIRSMKASLPLEERTQHFIKDEKK